MVQALRVRALLASCLALAIAAVATLADASPQAARIDRIDPAAARRGELVTLEGIGFGARNVEVSVGVAPAEVVEATGSRVVFRVPAKARFGPQVVTATNPGVHVGSVPFEVEVRPEPVLDEDAAVEQPVGPGGAVLRATSGGVDYTLTFPPDAVMVDTPIRMTPVVDVVDLPPVGGYLGGVHLAPDGLVLTRPAELVIEAPGPLPTHWEGFAFRDGGHGFHLVPSFLSGGRIRVPVVHFTTTGATGLEPDETTEHYAEQMRVLCEVAIAHDLALPEDCQLMKDLEDAAKEACGGHCEDPTVFEAEARDILDDWYDETLKPKLDAAAAGEDPAEAAKGLLTWGALGCAYTPGSPCMADPRWNEGFCKVGQSFGHALQRDEDACDDRKLAAHIQEIDRLGAMGAPCYPASSGDIVQEHACSLRILVTAPPTLDIGTSGPADVTLEVKDLDGVFFPLGGQDVTFTRKQGCGTVDGAFQVTHATDLDGRTSATLLATESCFGVGGRIDLDVVPQDVYKGDECGTGDANGDGVTDCTFLAFGRRVSTSVRVPVIVTIAPASATLAPGQELAFTADTRAGFGVAWTATGGTLINPQPHGVTYQAGIVPGDYDLRADSLDDEFAIAHAPVTITPMQVTVTPEDAEVETGGTLQYVADLHGSPDGVTWSVTGGGSINASGLFTAGASPATYEVTATSVLDPTQSATVTGRVVRPGPHYDLELILTTGGSFTALHPRTSINSSRRVAFIGTESGAQQVFVIDAPNAPARISFVPGSGRTYLGAAINDEAPAQVASRDQLGTDYFVRKWRSDASGSFTVVGRSGPLFDSALGFPDLNDSGVVAFTALTTTPITQTILYGAGAEPPTELARFNGNVALRPAISGDGQVFVRDDTGRIIGRAYPSGAAIHVAGSSDGFDLSQMGDRPGVSVSGDVVGFAGNRGAGPGAFMSVRDPAAGTRTIFQIAGAPEFSDVVRTGQRVGVTASGSLGTRLETAAVFLGTSGGVSGVHRVDVDFRSVGGVVTSENARTMRLVALGESVGGKTISSVDLYDPIAASGDVVFFASFTDGTQGIVRATYVP